MAYIFIQNEEWFGYIDKKKKLRLTGLYMLRRLTAARATKNRSRANALCAVFLRHIFAGLQTYGLLIRPAKTSYTAGTLCAIALKHLKIYFLKSIDKIKYYSIK
jgi:hypothetical protein